MLKGSQSYQTFGAFVAFDWLTESHDPYSKRQRNGLDNDDDDSFFTTRP